MINSSVFYKNEQVDRGKWQDLLLPHPFASVFQSPGFYDFYNSVSGCRANVYALATGVTYQALCVVTFQKELGLKGYFSRRAIVYGGPLVQSPEHLSALLDLVVKDSRKDAIYLEIRNSFNYKAFNEIFTRHKWQYLPYLNFELDLRNTSVEQLIGRMKYNRRREIKISMEQQATYHEATDLAEVLELYSILAGLYETRVKLPLPAAAYFEKLFLSPVGKIIVVKHANRIIGGAFCLFLPSGRIFTLYYCGKRDYHKKIFPTHLAIVGVMDFASRHGIPTVDFMGAGKKGEEYGVRKYKEEFGGTLVENGRFIHIHRKLLYKLGTAVLSLKQKIKK